LCYCFIPWSTFIFALEIETRLISDLPHGSFSQNLEPFSTQMPSQSRSCIPYCHICFSCILFACQEDLSLVHEDSSLCSIKPHTVLGTKALREKSSLLHSLLLLCANQIVLSILQLTSYPCQRYLEVVLTVCSILVTSSLLVPNQTSLPRALSLTYSMFVTPTSPLVLGLYISCLFGCLRSGHAVCLLICRVQFQFSVPATLDDRNQEGRMLKGRKMDMVQQLFTRRSHI